MDPIRSNRNRFGPGLLAALWFAVWHFVITANVWRDPLHRVPGPIGDNTVMLWNLGWVRHALQRGETGFWFTNAYYPDGFFFLYGTPTWLDGFLFWLASPLLPGDFTGAILWANGSMLLATVASGLLIMAALRAWQVQAPAILLLVSSAVVFSWFRTFALTGHYHFFGTQWMLGSLAAMSWAVHAASAGDKRLWLRRCLGAGLLLGIAYLNDQAMAVFGALLSGFMMVAVAGRGAGGCRWKWLLWGGTCFAGGTLVVASIHLVPTAMMLAGGRVNYWIDKSPRLVDATSLILPPGPSFLGGLGQRWREMYGLTWSEGTYVGIVPLLLLGASSAAAVVFASKREFRGRPGAVIAGAALGWMFVIAALGDRLVVGPHQLFTMPGRLLKELPVLNNIRLPQRWIWPAQLCIGFAGAALLSELSRRWPQRRGAITGVLAVLAFVPPLEAINAPPVPALDYKNDDYLRPPVFRRKDEIYQGGTVLMMPAYKAYGHGNVLQFLWGYDVPLIMTYTARMPIKPADLPWQGDAWDEQAGAWLRENNVQTVIFPFDDGSVERSREWIVEAKKAVPGLHVYDRRGEPL